MKIAIAACARYPELSASNACLRDALTANGAEAPVLLWNRDTFASFLACDLILLRQTWDYMDDPGGFASWLIQLETLGGRAENPGRLAIWNNDKRTLSQLDALGVETPRTTTIVDDGQPTLLAPLPQGRIVLKPAFGGGGHGVKLCEPDALAEEVAVLRTEAPGQPIMAQEFLPEIADGEWKMTCIDGSVALAIHAVPRNGEFRINNRFGPDVTHRDPPEAARRAAETLMHALGTPLCGRVDGVMRGNRFLCTELELTDPDLHLHHDADVAHKLARGAIARVA